MYSAYKLNKQGDNIEPWYTSFPIWNETIVHANLREKEVGNDFKIMLTW